MSALSLCAGVSADYVRLTRVLTHKTKSKYGSPVGTHIYKNPKRVTGGKYGFHIEKEQTTSFFRDVRVYPAERIDNKDEQNQSVNKKDFVGMYCVMLWIERSRSRK